MSIQFCSPGCLYTALLIVSDRSQRKKTKLRSLAGWIQNILFFEDIKSTYNAFPVGDWVFLQQTRNSVPEREGKLWGKLRSGGDERGLLADSLGAQNGGAT